MANDGTDRVSIPLRMLRGNLEILLALEDRGEKLNCNGISLRRDPDSIDGAVILLISGLDSEQQEKLGFQTGKLGKQ